MKKHPIVIDTELHTALSSECRALGMTRNALLRVAFGQWIRGGRKITREVTK